MEEVRPKTRKCLDPSCGLEKPLEAFGRAAKGKYGRKSRCLDCERRARTKWAADHPSYFRDHYVSNRDEILQKQKESYLLHREEKIKNSKRWAVKNPERNRALKRDINRNRYQTDVNYRLSSNLRSRLHKLTSGLVRAGSAIRDLGCTIEEFCSYLMSRFRPGMSWANYGSGPGRWNIDHEIPLAAFDLTNREQFLKACHYSNLQPMWASENFSKSDKMPWENRTGAAN